MRWKWIGGFALALVAIVVSISTALAHSRPVRFEPGPGAVLTAAPSKIDGWFTSEVRRDPNWSFLHVTDAQGARVDTGETALSSSRLQMTATLKSGLAPGMYVVTWRTYDDGDGEIFGDCYTFFVGQAAADAAVSAKTRLDGGGKCERIEFDTKEGTPTPAQVSSLNAASTAEAEHMHEHESGGGSSTGKLIIGLVIGALAGVVVGGLGARLVDRKA